MSGFTVMAAMAGMFLAGEQTFTALGVGAIMVVAVAMIGSVTVVPAVLAALGDRVDKGRMPFLVQALHRRRRRGPRLERAARRRPAPPGRGRGPGPGRPRRPGDPGLLMHTALTGTNDLPRKLEVMRVYDRMQAAFPGGQIPAVVVIEAKDVTRPPIAAAVKDLERGATAPADERPGRRHRSQDKHVAQIAIPIEGDGTDDGAAALADLRDGIVPAHGRRRPGVTTRT